LRGKRKLDLSFADNRKPGFSIHFGNQDSAGKPGDNFGSIVNCPRQIRCLSIR
jgi:hypothetical protein